MPRHLLTKTLCSALICLGLSACGEPAPAGWNANLDIDCKPQDPFDKMFAMFSTEKFWRLQEYDMASLLKAGEKNLAMSRQVFDDSQAQKGDYFSRASQAARELGLTGSAQREHIKDNMDRYNKEMKAIEERIKKQEVANRWTRKCQRAVETELRKLGLQPVPYDPEKRPM